MIDIHWIPYYCWETGIETMDLLNTIKIQLKFLIIAGKPALRQIFSFLFLLLLLIPYYCWETGIETTNLIMHSRSFLSIPYYCWETGIETAIPIAKENIAIAFLIIAGKPALRPQ